LLAGEGDPDVLIVGSTDCIHCQNFVSKGLDALLAAAVEEGWTVAYLPLATGPASLVSAHALSLVADAQDKPSALRATYMLSSLVRNEGLAADDQGTRFAALVGDPTLAARWTSPDVDKMAVYMRALVTAFNVKSTPSFYVQSKDGTEVRMFSGFVDGGRVVEQIRAHR
jgi:hypothetical protein